MTSSGDLVVRATHTPGADVLALSGVLDITTHDDLWNLVAEGSYAEPVLILDLNDVTFLDSRGLGCLVTIRRAVVARGGDVVLVSAEPRTTKIIKLAGLDRVFRFTRTMDAALPPQPPAE